jgi:hypothetical protein
MTERRPPMTRQRQRIQQFLAIPPSGGTTQLSPYLIECALSRTAVAAALVVQAPAPLPELAADLEPSAAWRAAGMRFLEDAEAVLCERGPTCTSAGSRTTRCGPGGLASSPRRGGATLPGAGVSRPAPPAASRPGSVSHVGSSFRGCWMASSGRDGRPGQGGHAGQLQPGCECQALRYLLGCPRLLVAYDVDAEGEKGAEPLGQLSPRMRRIRPPVGKDVTAFWQAGGRVRDWAAFELARCKAEVHVTSIGSRHPAPPPARASTWAGVAVPLNGHHPVATAES